ncbi:hypothetical protein FDECE_1828 [Fusarium decemcellulare]|nr:hypothetical protein FDECE_1828 [Fusarium decemcellulare]
MPGSYASGRPRKASLAVESSSSSQGLPGTNSPSSDSTPSPGTCVDGISNSITVSLPDLTQIDVASDLMDLTPETDFLYQMDLGGGLCPGSSTSSNPTTLDGCSWLDSLISNEQLTIPRQNSEKNIGDGNNQTTEHHSLKTPELSQIDPMLLAESNPSDGISEIVEALCRLQQELMQLRRPSCGYGDESSTMPPYQSSLNPVDAVLRPGQELVDTVHRLLNECTKGRGTQSRRRLIWDRRTLLPLVFTPLSLLLSTYGDLIRELGRVSPQSHGRAHQPDPDRLGADLSLATPRSSVERGEYQHQIHSRNSALPPTPSSIFSGSHQPSTLLPGNLNLSLGEMSLDRPLQLIIVTTVIKHHLTHLEDSLHVYGTQHMHQCELCPSEGFFLSALAELRSYTRLLISETSKIVH